VLGPVEVGENSLVGAGAVLVKSVPPSSTVVGIPGKVVSRDKLRTKRPESETYPDPDAMVLSCILARLEALELNLPEKSITPEERRKVCVFQHEGVTDSAQCLTSR